MQQTEACDIFLSFMLGQEAGVYANFLCSCKLKHSIGSATECEHKRWTKSERYVMDRIEIVLDHRRGINCSSYFGEPVNESRTEHICVRLERGVYKKGAEPTRNVAKRWVSW